MHLSPASAAAFHHSPYPARRDKDPLARKTVSPSSPLLTKRGVESRAGASRSLNAHLGPLRARACASQTSRLSAPPSGKQVCAACIAVRVGAQYPPGCALPVLYGILLKAEETRAAPLLGPVRAHGAHLPWAAHETSGSGKKENVDGQFWRGSLGCTGVQTGGPLSSCLAVRCIWAHTPTDPSSFQSHTFLSWLCWSRCAERRARESNRRSSTAQSSL